jgi:hypothetical protein
VELLTSFCLCFLKINPVLANGVYGALTPGGGRIAGKENPAEAGFSLR